LPSLAYEGVTLVVSPLIALMEQQVAFLASKGVPAACLTSGKTADEEREVRERLRRGALKLLYVAPERFNNERFRGLLQSVRIGLFAVDEAHCISEWGHNFRPDYLKLAQAAKECRVERVLALTATATPQVAEDICAGFDIPMAGRLDVKREVLATALTYLELDGLLRQRTPLYLGYELKFLRERDDVLATFDEGRRRFLAKVFDQSKKGRIWLRLDPREVAKALGEDRTRIVKALDYLAEKGHIELRTADARSRYSVERLPADRVALLDSLHDRFDRRERNELARIQEVLALVTSGACQANVLAQRFGEARSAGCGTCSACRGLPRSVQAANDPGPIAEALDRASLAGAQTKSPVLRDTRSAARFLCGIPSPGLARARLYRHPLFGSLGPWRFGEALDEIQAATASRIGSSGAVHAAPGGAGGLRPVSRADGSAG
jgi:ATP-dependent DNA helicase RecQ